MDIPKFHLDETVFKDIDLYSATFTGTLFKDIDSYLATFTDT